MKNLKADEIFLLFIIIGSLFLILGLSFYFLYIKPKQDKKRRQAELKQQKLKRQQKELDERIKKNQQYWKQVADYMNLIEKENNKD